MPTYQDESAADYRESREYHEETVERLHREHTETEELPCSWCGEPMAAEEDGDKSDEHHRCLVQAGAERDLAAVVEKLGRDAHDATTEYHWTRRLGSAQGAPEKNAALCVWKLNLIASIALAATPETLGEIATIMRHDAAHWAAK